MRGNEEEVSEKRREEKEMRVETELSVDCDQDGVEGRIEESERKGNRVLGVP